MPGSKSYFSTEISCWWKREEITLENIALRLRNKTCYPDVKEEGDRMGEYRQAKHYSILLVCYKGELTQRTGKTQVQARAA